MSEATSEYFMTVNNETVGRMRVGGPTRAAVGTSLYVGGGASCFVAAARSYRRALAPYSSHESRYKVNDYGRLSRLPISAPATSPIPLAPSPTRLAALSDRPLWRFAGAPTTSTCYSGPVLLDTVLRAIYDWVLSARPRSRHPVGLPHPGPIRRVSHLADWGQDCLCDKACLISCHVISFRRIPAICRLPPHASGRAC
jgi:hypothetical protein